MAPTPIRAEARPVRIPIAALLALAILGTPEHTSAQEPPRRDRVSVVAADSTTDATFLRHAFMSAVGSGVGARAGLALASTAENGGGLGTAQVTFGVVGSIIGSSALMALTHERLSFDPALGASTVGVLGGLAATLIVLKDDRRGFEYEEEAELVVVFSVGQAFLSAAVADGLGY